MCDCDTDDPPTFFESDMRKARKEHRCVECRRSIHAGDRYEYAAGVWDGDFYAFKTCLRCVGLRAAHTSAAPSCSAVFGELLSQIGECSREDPVYLAAFRAERRRSVNS